MSRGQQVMWFCAGFALSALAAIFVPSSAHAQSQSGYSSGPSTTKGRAGAPIVDENDTAPDLPAAIPSTDPSADPEELSDDEQRPRTGQRAVVQDGDFNYPTEPAPVVDGALETPPEEASIDGADALIVDQRPAEDIAVFDNPPAGYDPLLFQIEELEPVADRRTERLFNFEPYDPVGVRIGSFVLFPEAEIGAAAYNNVFRAPVKESDIAAEFRPLARLVSNWSTHALEFRAVSNLSWFNEFSSEDEHGYQLEARGRLDITKRTNFQAGVLRQFSQESRSAIDASSAGDRTDLTVDEATLAFNHRFNRLSIGARGGISDYDYGPSNGVTNDDRDYQQTREAVRATWELKPTLSVFGETEFNQRQYDVAAVSDGIKRNSDGQRYRLGLSFGSTGQILRGEIAAGYGVQTPDDSQLAEIDGFILDANATWRITSLTALLFTARSDVTETTTANVGGAMTQSVGLDIRHEFRRHLIGTAGLSYTTQVSPDDEIDEDELRASLGAEYFVNREIILYGRYQHTEFTSNQPNTDYSLDDVRVGVRVRR